MFNNNSNNSIISTLIGAAGLIGLGYGLAMHTKIAKVSERLDQSIDSLADNMEIDIPDELINKAVDKAVSAAAKNAVSIATNNAVAEVKHDIRVKVSAAVEKEYESIKDNVLKEIIVATSKIDESRVRREVEKAAKEAALKKFDDNLDDILEKFNGDLDNTAKIYSAIKNVLNTSTPAQVTPSPKEYVFRVGC